MRKLYQKLPAIMHPTNLDVVAEKMAWINIRHRCLNPMHKAYRYYGARGITICEQWATDFMQFISDVGVRPEGDGTRKGEWQIDRINNDLGYFPGNVRWTTRSIQMNNRRGVHLWKR